MGESGAARPRGALPVAMRVLLVVGFVIAVAATALVVFADDVQMLRLAAVLALWAALIGAFAVTRSRRDARAAVMRENEAQFAYQLELHREVAARREYEADLSRQVAAAQSDQLAELRGQLERLTGVLSSLVDGELTVSRLTLSAESARFRPGAAAPAMSSGQAAAVTAVDAAGATAAAELAPVQTVDADPDRAVPGAELPVAPSIPQPVGTARPDAPAGAWASRHAARARSAAAPAAVTAAARAAVTVAAAVIPSAADMADTAADTVADAVADAVAGTSADAVVDTVAGTSGAGHAGHEAVSGVRVPEQRVATVDAPEPGGGDGDGDGGGATEPAGDGSAPAGHVGDGDEGNQDHEPGVSVADLLAAYGLSGHSRRRRRE